MAIKDYLRRVKASPIGAFVNAPRRFVLATQYIVRPIAHVILWLYRSKEDTNFTYQLVDSNIRYLTHFISQATNSPLAVVRSYIDEILCDDALKAHVINKIKSGPYKSYADLRCDFGRRIGWYALVRILKPDVVVETGVDKGFGSVVLCAALLRNSKGVYYGTDNNPGAGYLLSGQYATVGKILYGDSIESLQKIAQKIDIFINDSDHSAIYERREYDVVTEKLSAGAVVVADNAHASPSLLEWSEINNRRFMFWREQPKDHWYPGGGIGLSLPMPN